MTSAEAVEKLNKDALKSWLETKQPDEPVGYEHRACYCPIATFFKEKYAITVQVGNWFDLSTFHIQGDKKGVDLPDWAISFASEVDEGECSEEFKSEDEIFEEGVLYRPVTSKLLELLETV